MLQQHVSLARMSARAMLQHVQHGVSRMSYRAMSQHVQLCASQAEQMHMRSSGSPDWRSWNGPMRRRSTSEGAGPACVCRACSAFTWSSRWLRHGIHVKPKYDVLLWR